MRKITRSDLSVATHEKLLQLTARVASSADPKAEAAARWAGKPRAAFEEVRQRLEVMAPGRARCMYCEDNLGTDIDHFWPKSDYPERAFQWANYLLACSHCNSNLKRDEFPLDSHQSPLLLDPTDPNDDPVAHLTFLPTDGTFSPNTQKGVESIRVFGLNDDRSPRRLPTARRDTLVTLLALLKCFDAQIATDPTKANAIRDALRRHPFSAVMQWLVSIASRPSGAAVLGVDVVQLVQKHQVSTWL
jgi:uncharacterized protein (TIGR02646 family)